MKRLPIIVLVAIFILPVIIIEISCNFNDHKYIIIVTDKERVVEGGSSKYLIFGDTDSGESLVFENTDNLIRGKFNSSNIQGKIKVGQKYQITVTGYRVPFFSLYENIVDIQALEGEGLHYEYRKEL